MGNVAKSQKHNLVIDSPKPYLDSYTYAKTLTISIPYHVAVIVQVKRGIRHKVAVSNFLALQLTMF